MKATNHRAEHRLPVTAELGDEGGSYGDATAQAETFKGELGNPQIDQRRGGPSAGDTDAVAPEPAGVSEDLVKHPTEPPDRT